MMAKRNQPEVNFLTRRDFLSRVVLKGAACFGATALGNLTLDPVHASSSVKVGLKSWILDYHNIDRYSSASNHTIEHHVLPTGERNVERILHSIDNGTLDVYLGMTPFVEMQTLAEAGVIEPWNSYVPESVINDIIPAVRNECSIDGQLYCWPFVVDLHGMAWNSRVVNDAGVPAPAATWEEYLDDAEGVVESLSAPYGATFDPHGWRSLVPFAHSFSGLSYASNGLFDFSSEAAAEALMLMKQILQLSHPDILQHGASIADHVSTPDEIAFASEQVGFYTKYLNAPIRMAKHWNQPSDLRLAPFPRFSGAEGSPLFWSTGAALIKNGKNKETAAEFIQELTLDKTIWKHSLDPSTQSNIGQLPPYKSIYANWRDQKPDWLPDHVLPSFDELQVGSSIVNHRHALKQFIVGQPIWEKYLYDSRDNPKSVLQDVAKAVSSLDL